MKKKYMFQYSNTFMYMCVKNRLDALNVIWHIQYLDFVKNSVPVQQGMFDLKF